jgi:hypothetical protein
MPPSPSGRLEFTDCHGCGKRVATTATICRHCNTKRDVGSLAIRRPGPRDTIATADLDEDPEADSHAALSLGGYGKDDYDDEQEGEKEPSSIGVFSKMQNFWWYVALILLIFFVVTALLPQVW